MPSGRITSEAKASGRNRRERSGGDCAAAGTKPPARRLARSREVGGALAVGSNRSARSRVQALAPRREARGACHVEPLRGGERRGKRLRGQRGTPHPARGDGPSLRPAPAWWQPQAPKAGSAPTPRTALSGTLERGPRSGDAGHKFVRDSPPSPASEARPLAVEPGSVPPDPGPSERKWLPRMAPKMQLASCAWTSTRRNPCPHKGSGGAPGRT